MRAVIVNKTKNNKLEIDDIPKPEPKINEVRIKVFFAGVNRPDILQKKGLYPPPTGASTRLGLEASGIIEKVGKNVKTLREGDKVCGLTPGGAYADSVVLRLFLLHYYLRELKFALLLLGLHVQINLPMQS